MINKAFLPGVNYQKHHFSEKNVLPESHNLYNLYKLCDFSKYTCIYLPSQRYSNIFSTHIFNDMSNNITYSLYRG